jgi:DNA repair protein RadC
MNDTIQKVSDITEYHPKIKDWPEPERPREKLLKMGPGFLTDAELIALLIGSGTNGITAIDVAKKLLVDNHQLTGLSKCNYREIVRLKGIGRARAAVLMAAFEIGRRIESQVHEEKKKVSAPDDIVRFLQPAFRALKQEVFKVILLDSGNRIIRDIDITRGTLNASLVHPREVFKTAVDHLAAGVILVHNHPSGETQPSVQDKEITRQLVEAGQIMGIPVLDHLIITQNGYYSFAGEGLI